MAASGENGIFKSVCSAIYDDKGKVYSIIGKLIDVSEEEAEKQELIKKSETDGLTGLYNAATTNRLITERIQCVDLNKTSAFIIIDCDKFKSINDNYGHLQGDKALVSISEGLTETFRETDIIGRIGGDEFCVFMENIPSKDLVLRKCQRLMKHINELNQGFQVKISIGIALLAEEKSYEELLEVADRALYEAKANGGANIQFAKQNNMESEI